MTNNSFKGTTLDHAMADISSKRNDPGFCEGTATKKKREGSSCLPNLQLSLLRLQAPIDETCLKPGSIVNVIRPTFAIVAGSHIFLSVLLFINI